MDGYYGVGLAGAAAGLVGLWLWKRKRSEQGCVEPSGAFFDPEAMEHDRAPSPAKAVHFPDLAKDDPLLGEVMERVLSGDKCLPAPERIPQRRILPEVEKRVLAKISELENFGVRFSFSKMFDDPDLGMNELAKAVKTDPLFTAKVLKTVNSAFFGLESKVDSIHHAVSILGVVNMKNLYFHEYLFKKVRPGRKELAGYVKRLWEHLALTAVAASFVARSFDGVDPGFAYTMGILHDVGKFVSMGMPQAHDVDNIEALFSPTNTVDKEHGVFGVSHGLIGRYACDVWKLPDSLAKAIELHHIFQFIDPHDEQLDPETRSHSVILHIADQIAKAATAAPETALREVCPLPVHFLPGIERRRIAQTLFDGRFETELAKTRAVTALMLEGE